LATHSFIFFRKSACLIGGVVRPLPGDHAQKTSGSLPMGFTSALAQGAFYFGDRSTST
jgi:hypothetical protein